MSEDGQGLYASVQFSGDGGQGQYTVHHFGGAGREYLRFGRLFLPRRFAVTVDDPELGPFELRLEIEVTQEAGPVCRELVVKAKPGAAVSSREIRNVPIGKLVRYASRRAAQKAETVEQGGFELLPTISADEVKSEVKRPRRAYNQIDDEHLAKVADIYRLALAQGDPPTQRVADDWPTSRSNAGRWVVKARQRGLLGKAIGPRAGEEKETK